MRIRDAAADDAAAIARVHINSWRAAYRGIVPDDLLDRLDESQRTQQWVANIAGNSVRTVVADIDGKVAGFASFAATRDDDDDPRTVAEIQAIYVCPDAWGTGIGRALCTSVIAELAAQSYHHVTLWVLRDNHLACRFYERAGFDRDGKTKTEVIGVPLQVVRYRRALP